MDKHYLSITEASKMLGLSPSTLRRLENNNKLEGYGLNVYYTPGGQRRYHYDELKNAYHKWGTFGKVNFGKKPCIIIRDLIRYFTDHTSKASYSLDDVVLQTKVLLEHAKKHDVPVIFVIKYFEPNNKASKLWANKIETTQMLTKGAVWTEIDPRISNYPYHSIIYTPYLSPFFQTDLAKVLEKLNVDTTIIVGNSASGSVRISAVDSLQHGLHPIIPREAVGDRTEANKQTALLEINAKYADVVAIDSVIDYFKKIKRSANRI